ncbi:hypothetical protein M378DRAFT_117321 [Amanita muscaria Koide BX008]|uniref:INO80 complex subunit F domain-containing protein n=1 Tax=Amanita muscaria (strain Koide BX008) TaxID=946122 RepID=A0A0C2T324_AMAMK|nr:hypothetical protein M378DRAFT_117321 [Amanita muscaria Koide BX008]
MSRHPSPGPSAQHPHQPPSVSSRQKQPKPYAVGIAAGAEDVKYQTKYKELKRKVKDIESDNDKLHYKLLQAKRSIQRMKVERALVTNSILYERLSPPPPEAHDRHAFQHSVQGLPYPQPIGGHPGNVQLREMRDHPPSRDDHPIAEYMRSQGNSRGPPPSDARHLPSVDYPIVPGVSSPHIVHSPRRTASGHDAPRQFPPLQQLPPMPIEIPRTHSLPPHASPPIHHAIVPSSNERSRPHHSSHSRGHQPPSQSYMQAQNQPSYSDSRTPTHHAPRSPSLPERERPRRHDMHEMNEPHNLVRQQSPSLHPADTRSVSRMHNQPMGPGVYMSREEQHDRQQDSEREREWERSRDIGRNREFSSSRMQSPPLLHRSRSVLERGEHSEHPLTSRIREDSDYYHGVSRANYSMHQRPDSASSRSGSGDGQRSENPHYDGEHYRTYRLRPVNQDDVEFGHHDNARSQNRESGGGGGGNIPPPPQEPSRGSADNTRKRNRNEMDVDSDPESELAENMVGRGGPGNTGYISGRNAGDRSIKRYHMPRDVDSQEDSRMGPP